MIPMIPSLVLSFFFILSTPATDGHNVLSPSEADRHGGAGELDILYIMFKTEKQLYFQNFVAHVEIAHLAAENA